MKKLIPIFVIFFVLIQSCGINGFMTGQQGKFFQSSISDKFKDKKIERIGVFVFSDGKSADRTYSKIQSDDFPSKVNKDLIMTPDSSCSGPSMELALQVAEEIRDRGYFAKEVQELGHKGEIHFKDIIEKAKNLGYDAAFIVYYTGFYELTQYYGYAQPRDYKPTNNAAVFNSYDTYLYLPNAALFSTKDGEPLWSTQYYGLIERAHNFNFSNQGFNQVISKVIDEITDGSYPSAAKKAKDVIFRPKYWPKSYIEFPSIAQKKMKI